ncbi:hypothetical protein [Nonomuraea terrae]|uniref:hypothetical protein n=1 Tax=Nonomuraea terrae TaxID=2530383 RepID=UPI0014044830|nr:hypothetical protein [Nonomuraea terrae]
MSGVPWPTRPPDDRHVRRPRARPAVRDDLERSRRPLADYAKDAGGRSLWATA